MKQQDDIVNDVNDLKKEFPDQVSGLWLRTGANGLIHILILLMFCGVYMQSSRLLYSLAIILAIVLVVTLAVTGYTFYQRHVLWAISDDMLREYSTGKDADQNYYSRMFWDVVQIDVLIDFFFRI
jgi:hypothetical protein